MPLHSEIVRTETALTDAKHELGRVNVEIMERNRAEYTAAGGCHTCNGTGHYEHSFSDGGSIGCECTEAVDADGNRAVYSHAWLTAGDLKRHQAYLDLPRRKCTAPLMPYGGDSAQHDADKRLLDDAEESLAIAREQYERAVNLYDVVAGSTVRVVKGRKVKVGTVGVVTGLYDGQWGTSVGIRVKEGEKPVYTAIDNVLVVSSSFEQTNDLPDLYGSPKQVSWATKIRGEALRSGKVSVDVAQQYGNAKIWIDERDNLEAMQARMAAHLKGRAA